MNQRTWKTALRAGVIRTALLTIPVLLLALAYSSFRGGSGERLAITAIINVVIVVSIGIFVGNSGVESFGHIGFAAVGAYSVALLTTSPQVKGSRIPDAPFGLTQTQVSVLAGAGLSLVIVAMLAALVGLVVMRLSGISSTIVTLALLVVVVNLISNWVDLTGGAEAFYGIPTVLTLPIAVIAMATVLFVGSVFRSSPWGLLLQAAREDELAAVTMGVNVGLLRWFAFVLSAIGAGLGGVLFALLLGAITPNDFYLTLTFLTLAMLVLGGKRSTTGAVLGVIVITIGNEIFRWIGDGPNVGSFTLPAVPGLTILFLGITIVVVMIVRPAGIMGDREVDDFTLRWFRRSTEDVPVPVVASEAPTSRLVALDLVKHFDGVKAVDGVSLEVGPGEIVGLIGPNGAGKTTLLNLLSGVLIPDHGSVCIDSTPLPRPPYRVARSGLARTFQNIRLFGSLNVSENVQVTTIVAKKAKGRSIDPADLLSAFSLGEVAQRKARTLAYGDQRRLEIARAAAIGSRFVLLDEPVAGMNEVESLALRETIHNLNALGGAGILVVDHDLSFILGICERIYVLDAGRIIAMGPPEEIVANAAVIDAYIGTSINHQDGPQQDPDMHEQSTTTNGAGTR